MGKCCIMGRIWPRGHVLPMGHTGFIFFPRDTSEVTFFPWDTLGGCVNLRAPRLCQNQPCYNECRWPNARNSIHILHNFGGHVIPIEYIGSCRFLHDNRRSYSPHGGLNSSHDQIWVIFFPRSQILLIKFFMNRVEVSEGTGHRPQRHLPHLTKTLSKNIGHT